MKRNRHIAICLITLQIMLFAGSTGMAEWKGLRQHCKQSAALSDSSFLSEFPYRSCVKTMVLPPDHSWGKALQILATRHRPWKKILSRVLRQAWVDFPARETSIESVVAWGEIGSAIVENRIAGPDSVAVADLGLYVYDKVAVVLESGINVGHLDRNAPQLLKLKERLAAQQFYLNLDTSRWSKLLKHIRTGNWDYIFDRILKLWYQYPIPGTILMVAAFIICFFSVRFVVRRIRHRRKRKMAKSNHTNIVSS